MWVTSSASGRVRPSAPGGWNGSGETRTEGTAGSAPAARVCRACRRAARLGEGRESGGGAGAGGGGGERRRPPPPRRSRDLDHARATVVGQRRSGVEDSRPRR